MIEFDSRNLYPLLNPLTYSYQDSQEHSQKVDQWLGFQISSVETAIQQNDTGSEQQNWGHLSEQAFQTPYVEIRYILDLLKLQDRQHVVDLGSAYSRMGFIMHNHLPQCQFTGYELEPLRVAESQRIFSLHNDQTLDARVQDISLEEFVPPAADVYFIFDFGTQAAVEKILQNLKVIARQRPITVVGRGRLSRFCIHKNHPWLCEVHEPRHFAHFSIFQS